jgi:hypothetical protein
VWSTASSARPRVTGAPQVPACSVPIHRVSRGVPDERIGIVVDCRPVADRIVAGLGEHRSQHHVMSDDPSDTERWKRVVGRESWVVAWPERPAGAPMLTDLFEGLD